MIFKLPSNPDHAMIPLLMTPMVTCAVPPGCWSSEGTVAVMSFGAAVWCPATFLLLFWFCFFLQLSSTNLKPPNPSTPRLLLCSRVAGCNLCGGAGMGLETPLGRGVQGLDPNQAEAWPGQTLLCPSLSVPCPGQPVPCSDQAVPCLVL